MTTKPSPPGSMRRRAASCICLGTAAPREVPPAQGTPAQSSPGARSSPAPRGVRSRPPHPRPQVAAPSRGQQGEPGRRGLPAGHKGRGPTFRVPGDDGGGARGGAGVRWGGAGGRLRRAGPHLEVPVDMARLVCAGVHPWKPENLQDVSGRADLSIQLFAPPASLRENQTVTRELPVMPRPAASRTPPRCGPAPASTRLGLQSPGRKRRPQQQASTPEPPDAAAAGTTTERHPGIPLRARTVLRNCPLT